MCRPEFDTAQGASSRWLLDSDGNLQYGYLQHQPPGAVCPTPQTTSDSLAVPLSWPKPSDRLLCVPRSRTVCLCQLSLPLLYKEQSYSLCMGRLRSRLYRPLTTVNRFARVGERQIAIRHEGERRGQQGRDAKWVALGVIFGNTGRATDESGVGNGAACRRQGVLLPPKVRPPRSVAGWHVCLARECRITLSKWSGHP